VAVFGTKMVAYGRASDRGRIGVFYAFKTPKTHWRCIFTKKINFFLVKMTP
jgi:hypothetical protein